MEANVMLHEEWKHFKETFKERIKDQIRWHSSSSTGKYYWMACLQLVIHLK